MRALSVLSLIAGIFAFCSPALAHCRVTDLNLEPAISRQNELRQSANAQVVRDLRTLREDGSPPSDDLSSVAGRRWPDKPAR